MRETIENAHFPVSEQQWSGLCRWHGEYEQLLVERVPPRSNEHLARTARVLSSIYNAPGQESPVGRKDLLGARRFFFMPTDMVKMWLPLAEVLPLLALQRRKHLSVLDLGCGLGTASLGLALMLLQQEYCGKTAFTLVEPDRLLADELRLSLDVLRQLGLNGFSSQVRVESLEEYVGRTPERRHDLVVAMNVMCEAYGPEEYVQSTAHLVRRLLDKHVSSSGVVILLEPALKRFSRLVSGVDFLCRQEGVRAVFPCMDPRGCPHLSTPGGFCFHSTRVPTSPRVQSISARSGLSRHEVNFAYLTFLKSGSGFSLPFADESTGEDATPGRIVSFPSRSKKGFLYFVCTPLGLLRAFAPRVLPGTLQKGGKLPHGALVTVRGSQVARLNQEFSSRATPAAAEVPLPEDEALDD